jgi:hypothetical protein
MTWIIFLSVSILSDMKFSSGANIHLIWHFLFLETFMSWQAGRSAHYSSLTKFWERSWLLSYSTAIYGIIKPYTALYQCIGNMNMIHVIVKVPAIKHNHDWQIVWRTIHEATSYIQERSIIYHTLYISIWGGYTTCTSIKAHYKITSIYSTRAYDTEGTPPIAHRTHWNALAAFTTAIQFPYGLYKLLHCVWMCV